jgi:thiopeptide-type bacteriocin biosynthesis protein
VVTQDSSAASARRAVPEEAVLTVLNGRPLDAVASEAGLDAPRLANAVELYRAAGRAALDRSGDDRWHYWRLDVESQQVIDALLVTAIMPMVREALSSGGATQWWFLRKGDHGHHLRLRVFGPELRLGPLVVEPAERTFRRLVEEGQLRGYTTVVYEPEVLLFGGPEGMDLAHQLFACDTLHVFGWLDAVHRENGGYHDRRAELSLLLVHALLAGAGLDRFEQWDVWTRLHRMRPWSDRPLNAAYERNRDFLAALLERPDELPDALLGTGGAAACVDWRRDLAAAGAGLAEAHRRGRLDRGLREILVSHVVFHWSRLGLGYPSCAGLAGMMEIALRGESRPGGDRL